jgi:L-ascorbate metabolism protein UlaG (beta-lactamase superfamily)
MLAPRLTLIGGPTVLIEFAGLRLLTDPTFDGPGDYPLPHVTLHKTGAGASRLGGNAEGLAPWETTELQAPDGRIVRVTATPARHGPAGIEPFSGDVIGFVLATDGSAPIYVTGDTVWYDGVAEVARRFKAGVVLLFTGAAQTRGPFNLTMNVNDAIETAHAFPDAAIVPVHCEGWAHFTQDCEDVHRSFKALGIEQRLRMLAPGVPTLVERAKDM